MKMMFYWIIHYLRTFPTEQNRQEDSSMSGNLAGNILTQSVAIERYTPNDVTSPKPWKRRIFLATIQEMKKNVLRAGQELKLKNCGIKERGDIWCQGDFSSV